jgi:hypothetical protein
MKIESIKIPIIILSLSTSIIILGGFVNNRYFKKVQPEKQNSSEINLSQNVVKKDCSKIDQINNKTIDPKILAEISDKMINEWFSPNYEYTKNIPRQDKLFAIFILYTESTTNDNFIERYTLAIECEDKRIAKLLSDVSTPTNLKIKDFDIIFDRFWNQVKGKKIKTQMCSYSCKAGLTRYYFELNNDRYHIDITNIDFNSNTSVQKVLIDSFSKCDIVGEPKCE